MSHHATSLVMNWEQLGRDLHALRTRTGLTQRQVASASGVGHTFVSHLENGIRNTTLETLERIVAAAGGRLSVEILSATPADPRLSLIEQLRTLDEDLWEPAGHFVRAMGRLAKLEPAQRRLMLRQLKGWVETVEGG